MQQGDTTHVSHLASKTLKWLRTALLSRPFCFAHVNSNTFACRGEKLQLAENITSQPEKFRRQGERPGALDLSNPGLLDKKVQSTDTRRLTAGIRSD